jgi:LacI family transcriptional regulator
MPAVTIRDVAREAGVGVGTVSRVLNDNPFVSETTRMRVMAAIEALDYSPSPVARNLSLGRTSTVAVIAPFFTRPSVVERLRGIECGLSETDYDLVLHNVETNARRDSVFQSVPRRERIDGLLVISLPPSDADTERLLKSGLPIVLVDIPHHCFSRVMIDDVDGGYKATRHLIELGHSKIGYISDYLESEFNFLSSVLRYEGYLMALEEAGVNYHPRFHRQGEHGRIPARLMARELLTMADSPTAIFAASDTQAIGVLEAAREMGLDVPGDLSVIGYDDIELAEYLKLTTINQPLFVSGVEGAKMLLQRFEQPGLREQVLHLPTELVVRSTTGPVHEG